MGKVSTAVLRISDGNTLLHIFALATGTVCKRLNKGSFLGKNIVQIRRTASEQARGTERITL